ncbi:hypothetical protein Q31b_37720 [Novipirellula aureliae]|uniref:Uncharacterized protein n=1 Tax=Novipirellula aureliae TaxID=2527966 RepID=A0A5C6DR82_9BACT|nr:hypothetical protein [Novipirellula aureliae]TWU38694.1 hypothetical protein Q31b_37720 [Novipirellula aureliae]
MTNNQADIIAHSTSDPIAYKLSGYVSFGEEIQMRIDGLDWGVGASNRATVRLNARDRNIIVHDFVTSVSNESAIECCIAEENDIVAVDIPFVQHQIQLRHTTFGETRLGKSTARPTDTDDRMGMA